MTKRIAVLSGDGIGAEIMREALKVLSAISERFKCSFEFKDAPVGGAAFEMFREHFPDETRRICEESDAILFGSVGGPLTEQHLPKWKNCEANSILAIRKHFGFHANFRPARVYPSLQSISPLRQEITSSGVDLLIVRELNGDIYFGEHKTFERSGRRVATDIAEYTEDQIAAVARAAFEAARKRRKKLTSVDKANVLDTSKLWRIVVREVSSEFPDVVLTDMLVDNCAMQIIQNPSQFDVIVTGNLFGDILSDAAAVLPGSLGLTPSASLNKDGFGLYEPSGGSAPDIAGQGIANPIAQILSAAMMLRYSFGMTTEANAIEEAVNLTLGQGARTKDISNGGEAVSTSQMGNLIVEKLN